MAGEVFATGEDPRRVEPAREGERAARDGGGVVAEGAITDDRICGVGVDVEDRREIDIEPERAQLVADRTADLLCGLGVERCREAVVRHHRRPPGGGRPHALDEAALLIDRDQRRGPVGGGEVEPAIQGDERVEITDLVEAGRGSLEHEVALEQDGGAVGACRELSSQLARHRGPLEADPEQLTDIIAHVATVALRRAVHHVGSRPGARADARAGRLEIVARELRSGTRDDHEIDRAD